MHAHNLGFFYGDDEADAQPALRKVSLDIPAHSLTAIVGESGSGKSTLAALIAGELEGYSGSLAFEVDGESVEVADLRIRTDGAVSFVGARSHLFVGTLRDNLIMANPQATDRANCITRCDSRISMISYASSRQGLVCQSIRRISPAANVSASLWHARCCMRRRS